VRSRGGVPCEIPPLGKKSIIEFIVYARSSRETL
jgi:hypothetical protein